MQMAATQQAAELDCGCVYSTTTTTSTTADILLCTTEIVRVLVWVKIHFGFIKATYLTGCNHYSYVVYMNEKL